MNKSLKYGVFVLPYWPMKFWWGTRKVICFSFIQTAKMVFFWDFPIPPEGHVNSNVARSYIMGGRMLAQKASHQYV